MTALLKVARRECLWMRSHPKYLALVAVTPLLYMVALGTIYSPKKPQHIPVAIVDADHSRLSRELTRAILASETFSPGLYADSADGFAEWVATDRAHACFVFPHGLERDLIAHKAARVEVLLDNSNYLAGSTELSTANAILAAYSVGTETQAIEATYGIPQRQALKRATPFDMQARMWFNPAFNGNYLNILVVGLAYVAVQLAGLFLAIRAGSSELRDQRGTKLSDVTNNSWAALAGKMLPYWLISIPLSIVVTHLAHWLFGSPMNDGLSFCLVLIWFDAMLVLLGYGLSCLANDAVFATEMCASITMPNFLLSGYTWPIFAMPKIMWVPAYGLPMYPVVFMARKLTTMGASLRDCGPQLAALTVWTAAATALAWWGTRRIIVSGKGHAAHA